MLLFFSLKTPKGSQCKWQLETPDDKYIKIKTEKVSLGLDHQSGTCECRGVFMTLEYPESSKNYSFCGLSLPQSISSAENVTLSMQVRSKFMTNRNNNRSNNNKNWGQNKIVITIII